MPDGGNNIVFLFVNTETNVSMDYYIINRNQPQYFTNRKLRGEGKIRYVIYIKIYWITNYISIYALYTDQKRFKGGVEFGDRSLPE